MWMKRLLLLASAICIPAFANTPALKPMGADGKPLNLDFESGTLKDWTAQGHAFDQQPIHSDTVQARRADMRSGHQGNYWIGTYEIGGDAPQGTLTSVPFKVTHPYASFLVAGGSGPETRVELISEKKGDPIFKTSGYDHETLRPVVVDLHKQLGKNIFIRIVDNATGGWGHINFDDFAFYDERPHFANELDPAARNVPEADAVQFAGLSPQDAVTKMSLPPGFKATLFAGEPDIVQPVAFAIDDRGRLWVVEGNTYPLRAKEGEGKDKILVFEDTDGDGKYDKRTVFMDGLNLVSGIEVGFGGVWIGAAPYFMFIPVTNWDEPKPAGKPEILLDGWAYDDTHEVLNTFTWGPDGWLYGCHGVFEPSRVGKPGCKDSERLPMNCGVWRYHPTKHIFERFAEGTSNPWGIDFDANGQCITEGCVIPHLWHMIQGGHFQRQAGSHFNPYVFDDIKTIADHVHWAGDRGPHAGNGRSSAAGGGHAHAGLLVYQGDNFPAEWRGKVYMNNIHGACINVDTLEQKGSGFVGHHAPNFINFNDTWSQIINLETGPEGAVYMIDWYDKNQCHHNDPKGHDKTNGRIFRVSYGDPKYQAIDLQKNTDDELVTLLAHPNDWLAKHARRILQERATSRVLDANAREHLLELLNAKNGTSQLRALWTLHDTGNLDEAQALKVMRKSDPYLRAWAIQFVTEDKKPSHEILQQMAQMAKQDKSPVVRLYLASAVRRLDVQDRWDIVKGLFTHGEDSDDHNLPLMVWYGAEPLAALDSSRALDMATHAKLMNPILEFTTRRIAAMKTASANDLIVDSLLKIKTDDTQRQLAMLRGLQSGLSQGTVQMPKRWAEVESRFEKSSTTDLRLITQTLSLKFGSATALAALRSTLADEAAHLGARQNALAALLSIKDSTLPAILQAMLDKSAMRPQVLKGLAAYDDAATPHKILAAYKQFSSDEKRDALNTLVGRPAWAKELVAAVSSGALPKTDLTAELIRQLRNSKNPELMAQLDKVWGTVRESTADKRMLMDHYVRVYHAGGSQPGDASRGRAMFNRICQQCHTLFGEGGKVGPDLTGSNRADLGYILENVVDPNAVIPNEYRAWNVETTDDRTLTGIIKQQDDNTVTIVTANETLVLPRKDVREMTQGKLSMMPEGLIDQLKDQEVRDLLYYLSRPGQVPLPTSAAK
ncbi:MAG: putative rane-bound dehydrogenase [Verrucomicrobiales bacterium]|nr:putative rane-bound dehydrogenase [Verrucomicrobiales bacterium]